MAILEAHAQGTADARDFVALDIRISGGARRRASPS